MIGKMTMLIWSCFKWIDFNHCTLFSLFYKAKLLEGVRLMIIKDIIEAIKSYDTIIIHRHVRPDDGELGAQAGLKEIINASFSNRKVYLVGEEDRSLTFFARMDHIADHVYD